MKKNLLKIFVPIIVVIVIGLVLVNISNGAKPGDLLYGIDRMQERISLAFAKMKGDVATVQAYLDFADERLQEAEDLINGESSTALIGKVRATDGEVDSTEPEIVSEEDTEVIDEPIDESEDESNEEETSKNDKKEKRVNDLIEEYNKNVDMAMELALVVKEKNDPKADELLEEVSDRSLRHQERLAELLDKVPTQGRKGIENAMERSRQSYDKSLGQLSEDKKEEIDEKNEARKQEIEDKVSSKNDKVEAGDYVEFVGKLEEYNDACAADGECSAVVGEYTIVTNPGLTTPDVVIGTNKVNSDNIGEDVSVKALYIEEGKLTLVGDKETFIKLVFEYPTETEPTDTTE